MRACTCIRSSMRARAHALVSASAHLDLREFVRACSRAGLIKTQNAFARKKSQNSNALWVQKLSGGTIMCNSDYGRRMSE